ncbi:MAG TPA: hypothetical protein VF326_11620 [Anaerolineaceae bacterium]|jgi:hypothetical protein
MLELYEAVVLARQINQTLSGKRIVKAIVNSSPLFKRGYNIGHGHR